MLNCYLVKDMYMKKGLLLLALALNLVGFSQDIVSRTYYYKTNESTLSNAEKKDLLRWLAPHLRVRGFEIKLITYTDTVGSATYNDSLSMQRLKNLQNWLKTKDIPVKNVYSLGERYDLKSYTSNARYRKVEIHVTFATQVRPPSSVQPLPEETDLEPKKTVQSTQSEEVIAERMAAFAQEEKAIRLKIEFVGGQDIYVGNSEQDVILLADYLLQNPTKTAVIRGHVCCFNDLPLSILRAKAVYRDLVYLGVHPSRLSYNGYGNTMPITEEVDEETRQLNRRVDVIFSNSN